MIKIYVPAGKSMVIVAAGRKTVPEVGTAMVLLFGLSVIQCKVNEDIAGLLRQVVFCGECHIFEISDIGEKYDPILDMTSPLCSLISFIIGIGLSAPQCVKLMLAR